MTRTLENAPEKHHIVKINGGLGNQMFQYAFGCALESHGATVAYDLTAYTAAAHVASGNRCADRTFDLQTAFGLSLPSASPNDLLRLSDTRRSLTARLRRRLLGLRKTHVKERVLGANVFHPEVWDMPDRYFDGSWLNPLYFADCAPAVRRAFSFGAPPDQQNKDALTQIQSSHSVGIHVRRGDYLNLARLVSTQSASYYQQAVAWIAGQKGALIPFVFGDDIPWARENLHLENAVYVDWNQGENAFRDMQLLSQCRHLVIANSSFSWWAAWLNTAPEKIVVAPAHWCRDSKSRDLYDPSWHLM